MSDKPSVVLVHGGFVDGSGWQGVYDLLTADGYRVSVVQNPTLSLEGDAAATRMILDRQEGPTILVGHSYGGAVISEAGTHERVAGLVYICAFAPDAGESVNTLLGTSRPTGLSRRSCLLSTVSCSSTATSSTTRSQATYPPSRRCSSPTPRCPGASMRWAARSANPPGGARQLVPDHNPGSDDPARRTADDVRAHRRDRGRGRRQPLRLRLTTRRRRRPDQAGGSRNGEAKERQPSRDPAQPLRCPFTGQRKGTGRNGSRVTSTIARL